MSLVENTRIIVTGANSGIGLALVTLLIEKSMAVLGVDISVDNLLKLPRVHTFLCDVGDPTQIDNLLDYADVKMGGVDIFIANAGFAYYEFNPLPDMNKIQRIFQVNVESIIYTAHKLKSKKQEDPFKIIAVSSAMAFWPLAGYAQYGATKAAVHNFGKAYQEELSKNQYFQMVYPIGTKTAFFKQAGDSPKPLITQSAEKVAQSIWKGMQSNEARIFPSALFHILLSLNRCLGFVRPLVNWVERKRA